MKHLRFNESESIFGYAQRIKPTGLFKQLPAEARDMLDGVTVTQSQRHAFVARFIMLCQEGLNETLGAPVYFDNAQYKNQLATCRQCIDNGDSHAAYLQMAHISFCETHRVLLNTQCPSCNTHLRLTNSRLCRGCYNILPHVPVTPSHQHILLQKLLVSHPEKTSTLINALIALFARPLDTFDMVLELKHLSAQGLYDLMSFVADIIFIKGNFEAMRTALFYHVDSKEFMSRMHKQAIKLRWKTCDELLESVASEQICVNSSIGKMPVEAFAELFRVSACEYTKQVEHSFVKLEQLPKFIGSDTKTVNALLKRGTFNKHRALKQSGHYVNTYDIYETLAMHLPMVESPQSDDVMLSQLNSKILILFRANIADVIEFILQNKLAAYLRIDNIDAPLMERIYINKMLLEEALTHHFMEPQHEVDVDEFCKSLAVPMEPFVMAFEHSKFCDVSYVPTNVLTPTQVQRFLSRYESLKRVSRLRGLTQRKLLWYMGSEVEGIVDISFNDKNDGSAFLTLTEKNLTYIQDIKNKQLPPIKWQC